MSDSKKHDDELLAQKNRLLEFENERLHARLQELAAENAKLRGEKPPEQLALELQTLEDQVASMQKRLYGDSSEKRDYDKPPKEASQVREHSGRTPQPKLPLVETLVELADDDRECPACAGTLEEMGEQTQDTEVIDVIRRRFIVRRIRRQKYRCKCQSMIVVAPPSVTHRPHGRFTLDFGADVAVSKYGWAMPLDRQRRSMEADGLVVTTQTLWDQIEAIATRLEPVYDALREHIVGADVVGIDETWWRLMNKKLTKRWWVWAMQSGDAVYFRAAPSRSAQTAADVLGDFSGTLICDGYNAYETVRKRKPGDIKLALCWAHVRRKFVDAEPNYPAAARALELIGELFAIDRNTADPTELSGDEKHAAEVARTAARAQTAPGILETLKNWALEQRGLPKSSLRKAIDYMLGHWQALQTFIDDPYVPLDNNATERALRGIVIGRKNHYGSRSVRGTEVAAILYSLVESAKLAGLDPLGYIRGAVQGIEMGVPPTRLLPLPEIWPTA